MNLTGLTNAQVADKIKQGKVNKSSQKSQDTIGKIILRNTLTIFNLVNLILALMIISVGAYKNLLFVLIAIANTLISIINEIRAKRTIDKLKLISEQNPTVIRNGKTLQIYQSQIVEGDLLIYSLGDQIIVDSKITQGTVEVNESYITGEQDNITKATGDTLTSGSFVVSGTCYAEAIHVGADNFIAKLERDASRLKTADSQLFTIINNIVKYISFALIPIGALLLWARFRVEGTTTEVAVTSTVAGLINMIPEGLVLLTSSVLALATIRLSRKKVLVQDLYSVETLARVDTICLDKTGTLTTGKMTVHDVIPASPKQKNALETALTLILSHTEADNATSIALKQKFLKTAKNRKIQPIDEFIPFSSDRKYSGVVVKNTEYLMGAPEFLGVENIPDFDSTYRVLAVVKCEGKFRNGITRGLSEVTTENEGASPVTTGASDPAQEDTILNLPTKLLGYVLLEDEIRKDAKEIINYFYANDIAVKIISGDNLKTVQTIAKTVGVRKLNGIDLSTQDHPNYDKLVKDYNIFTRVTPKQKKNLINAFKKQGNTVAMTGDGVNDILAMKEADCSIAIGEGSDAARRSAKLVLLGSDFSAVPSIIDEGRQSINNLERSATLFLSKTTYAAILAVIFTIVPLEYPYAPIEMSLLNFACIGFPGIVLALEHNTSRIKNQFVKNIKKYSIPTGIAISLSMFALAIIAKLNNFSRPELLTASFFITFVIDFALIYRISRPLNLLRGSLLVIIIAIVTIAFLVSPFRNLLDLGFVSLSGIITIVAIATVALLVILSLRHLITSRQNPKSKV